MNDSYLACKLRLKASFIEQIMNPLKAEKIGILVFTESAKRLAERKPILKVRGSNYLFHSVLSSLARRILKGVAAEVIWWTEEHQKGISFQERLYHAIGQQFDAGFDRVIVLGTDHPRLNSGHINDALQIVRKGDQVIGPSSDGGSYLFSIDRSLFQAFQEYNFNWQSGHDFEALVSFFAERQIAVHTLEVLRDIDHFSDLLRWLGGYGHLSIAGRLRALLKDYTLPIQSYIAILTAAIRHDYNRGPPQRIY